MLLCAWRSTGERCRHGLSMYTHTHRLKPLVRQSRHHQQLYNTLSHTQIHKHLWSSTRCCRYVRSAGHHATRVQLRLYQPSQCMSTSSVSSSASTSCSMIHTEASPSPPLTQSLLLRVLPKSCAPYCSLMRLDRPVGTWLLLFPCWWSVALAAESGHLPSLWSLSLFAAGAFLMRGAGCTVNDMWDRTYDRQVLRTFTRPLASGELSLTQAAATLFIQLTLALGVVLNFNMATIAMAFSVVPIAALYPLMKRFTHWPQLVLGLCFNWGALLGVTSITGYPEPTLVVPLYTAGICWTIVYDTIYAHQDTQDDQRLGLYSTALYFSHNTTVVLSGFALAFLIGLIVTGWAAHLHWAYYSVSVGGSALHLLYQLTTLNILDRSNCSKLFLSNQWLGWLVLIGIVLDRLLADDQHAEVICKTTERREDYQQPVKKTSVWQKTGWQWLRDMWQSQFGQQPSQSS